MLRVVSSLSSNLNLRVHLHKRKPQIDNLAFKVHYIFTMWLLLILTVLLTSQELIGKNIDCIADNGVSSHVINTFCFFTSTFTMVKYMNSSKHSHPDVAHPGVGSMGINAGEPIKRHAYYQWVPFVLFFQALTFYIPHLIWKLKEDGRLKKLVDGLEYAAFASDKNISVGSAKTPTRTQIESKFRDLKLAFKDRLIVNKTWAMWLIICECLNLLNIIIQILFTDLFLGGAFFSLGPNIIREGFKAETSILDTIFPKMTKCTFHKFGPSGTIQSHDAMCVMALNIINEKIFAILWFWFLFVLIVSILALIWRGISAFLLGRSRRFNNAIYSLSYQDDIDPWKLLKVINRSDYLDWMFLTCIANNMSPLVFKAFIKELAKELTEQFAVPNLMDDQVSTTSSESNDKHLRFIDEDSLDSMGTK